MGRSHLVALSTDRTKFSRCECPEHTALGLFAYLDMTPVGGTLTSVYPSLSSDSILM